MKTEEQIKQNAEQYAINGNTRGSLSLEILFQNTRDAFIAGAHSRDEEIKGLLAINKALKKELKINEWERRNLSEICTQNADELDKLRNPWISVEERLPKEDKDKPGYSVEVIGMFHSGDIAKCFCSLEERIWFCDILTTYAPIAWMSIPKLK